MQGVIRFYEPVEGKIPVSLGHIYDLSTGLMGGLFGGCTVAILGMLLSVLGGTSFWYPCNVAAAAVLPQMSGATAAQLNGFNVECLIVGALVHLSASALIGVLVTLLSPTFPGHPILLSLVLAPAVWLTGFLMLQTLNPVTYDHLEPLDFVVGQLVFSLILGVWLSRARRAAA